MSESRVPSWNTVTYIALRETIRRTKAIRRNADPLPVYRAGDDWRARDLTDREREQRTERILAQAQDHSLSRRERIGSDPGAGTGHTHG